jgi:thymidylate synthase ThyX
LTATEASLGSRLATRDYPPRRIYAVTGVPPEVQAYALAKYSRSAQGMLESIQELSQQKAEEFLNTFYFQYGHRSIADLAHLVFGLEQVSILAAIAVVDEPVWDGQERSTRYQPFRKTGWHLPEEVAGTPAEATFSQAAEALFTAYQELSARLLEELVQAVPRPETMPDAAYRRTLRARAFDVARGLLPLATHTSVGQVVSARVLERQIGRLLGSGYAELRAVGRELKAACQRPPEAPLGGDGSTSSAAAPTLVKYADASAYPAAVAREFAQAASEMLHAAGPPNGSRRVDLVEPASDPLDEMVATLLYRHDAAGHSYRQCLAVVADVSRARKEEIFGASLALRGPHDDLLREHQAGYALTFDVLLDLGSFRDLHRHRRCVQVHQPLSWAHGFLPPEDVVPTLSSELAQVYRDSLVRAETQAQQVRQVSPAAADYLLPMAYRTRCLFKMDWAQAAYMIEQRTAPAGHFSYRRVAWEMYQALRERYPALAAPIRASDPHASLDLLTR